MRILHRLVLAVAKGCSNRTLRDGSFGGGAIPGTSCQATIAPSLWDISQQALASDLEAPISIDKPPSAVCDPLGLGLSA
jgi:hypothetical protein